MTARRLIGIVCTSLVLSARAHAQEVPEATPASPPSPQTSAFDDVRWTAAVKTVARTLDGSTPPAAMNAIAWPYASIVPFGRNRAESFRLLPERMSTSMTVVSARAHSTPVVSAASDLVADLEAGKIVPASILKRLVPQGEEATPDARAEVLRRADQTMARWLGSVLEANAPGTPVGVIVLYDDGTKGPTPTGVPTLWFALIRGFGDASGTIGVSRILYGPMSAATR